TPVSETPLAVVLVEVTLAKVPVTVPAVRLSAVPPDTLTLDPIVRVPKFVLLVMPVVGPVTVTPASVRLVFVPCSEMPVVPLVMAVMASAVAFDNVCDPVNGVVPAVFDSP